MGRGRLLRAWPVARALVISLVIAVGLADGCPLPTAKRTRDPFKPTVKVLRDVRTEFLRPFAPVREMFRLHQTWKLFPTASTRQHRMWIEGRTGRDAAWEILYRPNDSEHTFKADEIEYRRLRGAWNPGRSPRRGYTPFVKWTAREAFEARPDLGEVRVRLEVIRALARDGRWESLGKFQFEKTQRRHVAHEKPAVEPELPGEEPEP